MANGEQEKSGAIRPTLFIGLGGTGKEVLLRLRRKFYERFGEARLPCTAFLWLDTDTRDVMAQGERIDEIYQAVRFGEEEKIELLQGRVNSLSDVFQNRSHWHHVHDWLYDEVDRYGREISDGAGGVRAVGRLTFFSKYRELRERIESLLGPQGLNSQEVIDQTLEVFQRLRLPAGEFVAPPTPQVFLVCSIAGGTGCGTFLDMAFLLRDLKIDRVFSILFLPTVYYATPFGELALRSYGNSYAALKELEFYTFRRGRRGRNAGEQDGKGEDGMSENFVPEWQPGDRKDIMGPPFTATYFVGMMNEGGIGLKTRQELFAMVGESLFLDFMPSQFSTNKRSHYANVAQYLASPEARDVRVQEHALTLSQAFARRYASFGMSKIEVPVDSVKGACAAQLAHDIVSYWHRENDDPNVRRNVDDGMATRRVDADGISARFGENWKQTIRDAIRKLFQENPPTDVRQLRTLEDQITACERKLLRSDGGDQSLWGEVINALRGRTAQISTETKADLLAWIQEALDNPARGLRILLKDGGYLHFLESQMRGYHTPIEQNHTPEFTRRREKAERDAESWRREKEKQVKDLQTAFGRSTFIRILMQQETTVRTLLGRLSEAVEQQALAQAEVCLCEEAMKVAETAQTFLAEKRGELSGFAGALPGLIADLEKKKRSFLNFNESVLFIRHFNEVEDFKNFYKLDGKNIDTITTHREFLDWLAARKKEFLPVNTTPPVVLLHVINAVTQRKGDGELRTGIQDFCEERFRGDFNAFPRDAAVLEHPLMVNNWNDSIDKLVRCALPMVEREKMLAGSPVATQSLIYVQMSKDPKRDELYQRFYEAVCTRLAAQGYSRNLISPCFDETRSSEVILYIASYAFPLAALPVVKEQCHQSYYDFYRAQLAGQVKEQKNHIPLHLSKRWEGKFDDLKVYDDKEAREIKSAREVLLFGSALRVLEPRQRDGVLEFCYRQFVPPNYKSESLGNQREAIEILKRDLNLRDQMANVINERELELDAQQLNAYYWLLIYLSRKKDLPIGTLEKMLLEEKLKDIYGHWLPLRGISPDTTAEWNIPTNGNVITGSEEDKHVASAASGKLKDRMIEVGGFPALKELPVWIRR